MLDKFATGPCRGLDVGYVEFGPGTVKGCCVTGGLDDATSLGRFDDVGVKPRVSSAPLPSKSSASVVIIRVDPSFTLVP
jgi:hypothetical protein